jgi:hypothetical protein
MAGLPVYPYPQFPPQSARSVNSDGSMANPFYYLLQALFQRTGSDGGVAQSIGASISAAGSSQATATALSSVYNFITAGTGGVLLPTMQPGQSVAVFNQTASAINVYPPSGASINGGAANAAVSLPANTSATFVCQTATTFYTLGLQVASRYLSSIIAASPGVALTNNTNTTLTSLALPAGDWMLSGEIIFNLSSGSAANFTYAEGALWSTAATAFPGYTLIPADGASTAADYDQANDFAGFPPTLRLGPMRALLTGTTTFYLSALADFTPDTVSAGVAIRAWSVQPPQ